MTDRYEDIIHLSRPKSHRAKMSAINRAAQFAPFAALTGHEAAIQESGRITEKRRELDEEEKSRLNRALLQLAGPVERQPQISLRYFVPDETKAGGAYEVFSGRLKKMDVFEKSLIFEDGTRILIEDICQIQECF